jgi:hypothetical protein
VDGIGEKATELISHIIDRILHIREGIAVNAARSGNAGFVIGDIEHQLGTGGRRNRQSEQEKNPHGRCAANQSQRMVFHGASRSENRVRTEKIT